MPAEKAAPTATEEKTNQEMNNTCSINRLPANTESTTKYAVSSGHRNKCTNSVV